MEPRIRDTDGKLCKLELLFRKGNQTIIADVAVCWETPETPLSVAFQHEVATYSQPAFLAAVRGRYPDTSVKTSALIVGARGTWCAKNEELMRLLGLPRKVASWLITDVLRGGLFTHRNFGQVVWDPGARA